MATLAIVGPTASGKSDVALTVARRLGAEGVRAEIVAIDAFTVYRGMDIATAKPSLAVRAEVPHHLVDVLDPSETLTVADFQSRARRVIGEVADRAAVPLLVGGSGLYWRAVVDDLRFPPTDPTTRERIEQRWTSDPLAAHAHLSEVDPAAAARIDPANLRRTVRALEVMDLTGEPFSRFNDAWDRFDSRYGDLEVAYLDEAAALRGSADGLSTTAAQAIGYAEAFSVLAGDLDVEQLPRTIATRTWRYAKRQRGWFRADPRCHPTDPEEAVERLVAAARGSSGH